MPSVKSPVELSPPNLVVAGSIAVFLLTRFLPEIIVNDFVDSLIGRLLLVSFVIYGITLGPLAGVFSFLAVASLFAERNRSLIEKAKFYIMSRGSPQTLGQMKPHSTPATVGQETKERPWLQYAGSSAGESMLEGDGWNPLPAGESEDEKVVLESQLYPNDDQEKFYERNGLAPPTDPNKNA